MKYFFLPLLFIFQLQSNAQIEVDVPHFRSVQIDYDLKDYVTVSIDDQGGLYVENDSIAFSDLRDKLFDTIKFKSKYKELRISIMIIELVVDKDLTYEKLEKILFEFPKIGIRKIHFVCNSDDKIRFEKVCTTGFLYGMNPAEDVNSVLDEVLDSLSNEMDEEFIKLNKGYIKYNNEFIPPPPPPHNFSPTNSEIKNSKKSIKLIEILPSGYKIEKTIYSKKELVELIEVWSKTQSTSYVLSPSKNSNYQDILFPIAELKACLMDLWNEESQKRFDKLYYDLRFRQKREIRNKYPFILSFEAPN